MYQNAAIGQKQQVGGECGLERRSAYRISCRFCGRFRLTPAFAFGFSTANSALSLRERLLRTVIALCSPKPRRKNGPLTLALSPSEGERENRWQFLFRRNLMRKGNV